MADNPLVPFQSQRDSLRLTTPFGRLTSVSPFGVFLWSTIWAGTHPAPPKYYSQRSNFSNSSETTKHRWCRVCTAFKWGNYNIERENSTGKVSAAVDLKYITNFTDSTLAIYVFPDLQCVNMIELFICHAKGMPFTYHASPNTALSTGKFDRQ